MDDRQMVAVKCYKCGEWYHTRAVVEKKHDTMTHGEVTATFNRVILSRMDNHICTGKGRNDD